MLSLLFAITAREGRFFGYRMMGENGAGDASPAFSLDEAQQLLPGAATLLAAGVDEAAVVDASGREIGRLLHTQPLARHIVGYGSWLPIIIGINTEKRVTGLILQKNNETPGFVRRLEKLDFFKSWDGQIASDAIDLEVDAVSRATMTSRATIESVRLRLAKHLEIERQRLQIDYLAIGTEILAWSFLILALIACFPGSRLAGHRTKILLLAVIIPGFILGRFVSLELIHAWALNGIPFSGQLFMVVLMGLTILIPLLTRRAFYCTWYCPFGAAQELVGRLCGRKFDFSGTTGAFLRQLRPSIMMIIAFLLIVGVKVDLNSIEPFSAFLLKSASFSVIVLATVFLLISLVIRRPWCNYCCPSGQIVETLRTGLNAPDNRSEDKEIRHMKIQEVINLLLAIAVIILLMAPTRIAQNGAEHGRKADGPVSVKKEPVSVNSSGNQTLTTIHQRKSVRDFTGKEVSREQLTELVKAGMAAPTARNRQPWQFVAINDKAALAGLGEKLPYAKMLASAGAAIVVCGDLEIAKAGDSERMWMLDCSAAAQNILLAAESMGLGAVWTAAYPYEDRIGAVNEVVRLPAHVVPLCVIPIGYPAGTDQPKDKWKPERLHWNTFSTASSPGEIK